MSDNFALNTLHRQLAEQRNYLRLAKDQLAGIKAKATEAEAERNRRQQFVDDLEEAIALLEEISHADPA